MTKQEAEEFYVAVRHRAKGDWFRCLLLLMRYKYSHSTVRNPCGEIVLMAVQRCRSGSMGRSSRTTK